MGEQHAQSGSRTTSPRQLLYAMVAGGFHLIVGVLGWGSAALGPGWWNVAVLAVWSVLTVVLLLRWRRTGMVLGLSMLEFVAWTVGAGVLFT